MVRGVHRSIYDDAGRSPTFARSSSGVRLGTSYDSGIRNHGSTVFTLRVAKDKECEVCKRSKITRSPCRRRTGEAPFRAEKFGDFRTADRKAVNVDFWITEQSMARCRCPRSCHWMDSILSMQNQNFAGDGKECTKVCRHLICTWAHILRTDLSSNHAHAQHARRDVCCIATIRIGWKMAGWFHGMLLPSAKCPRPPGTRENTIWKSIWRTMSLGQWMSFSSNPWMSLLFSVRDQSRLHQSGKKVLPGIFLGSAPIAGEFGKELFWMQIWKIPGKVAMHPLFYPRRINVKDCTDIARRRWVHIPSSTWYRQKCQEETTNSENPLWVGNKPKGARNSVENFKVNLEEFQPTESKDDAEARADVWSTQGDVDERASSHWTSSCWLDAPNEEKFTIRLEYVDVTRSTRAWSGRHARETYRWPMECRFEKKLVRYVERFHEVRSVARPTFEGTCLSRQRLTKVQTTTRPWSRVALPVWTNIRKAAQNQETQELKTRSPNSIMLDDCQRNLLCRSCWPRLRGQWQKKCEEKIGKTYGTSRAKGKVGLAPRRWLRSRKLHTKRFSKRCLEG